MITLNKTLQSGVRYSLVISKTMSNLIKFLLLILLLQSGGCKWISATSKPYFFGTGFKVPPGTPVFQQGFKDGCSTILFARGNGFYRARNDYHYDEKLAGNPEYRFGHSRGQSWCFQTIIGANAFVSFDRYILPYGNNSVFDMSAGDINNTWDGAFNGLNPSTTGSIGSLNGIFQLWSGGESGGVFSANPIWAGGSKGQIFGQ